MNRSLFLACTLALGSVMNHPVATAQLDGTATGSSRIELEEAGCPVQQSTPHDAALPDSIHLKILLVEFADVRCAMDKDSLKPRYTVRDFETLLGSDGVYVSPRAFSPDGDEVYGSMNDYFRAMSGGRLRITASVVNRRDPGGMTPLWIRLPDTKAYYHNFPTHLSPFFADALKAAREAGLDAAASPDERVVIIYAGNLYHRGGGLNPNAGERVYCMSELQGRPYSQEVGSARFAHIGIHCHEFAHTIGVGHTSGGRADLMEGGTMNGTATGNAPAPLNAIARVRLGWATRVDVDTPDTSAADIGYSLSSPTVYWFKNGNGDEFYVENRRFDQIMRIGEAEVPDYNHALFFPPAWPHGTITKGLLVWRRNTIEDPMNPGYSREGLLYASGRYGQTSPEGNPSDTDDGVPFPGTCGVKTLSPWSDPRNPYMREPGPTDPSRTLYSLYVPNTKGGTRGGFEIISQDDERGTFGVVFRVRHPHNPAARNQSTVQGATGNNSQRKLFREPGGRVHMAFESGGEVFYNRSLNGGLSWEVARQISTGNGGGAAPCVTAAGGTVLIVWQVKASGAGSYAIHHARSTNAGNSWSAPASLAQIHDCTPPGPVPAAGGSHDGHAVVLARCGTGISCWTSSNEGNSWSPGPAFPRSTSAWGAPACVLSRSADGTLLAHVACADGGAAGESRMFYDALDVTNGRWTKGTTLSDVLPPEYADSRRPSIAASEGDTTHDAAIHVAWDARRVSGGSNRLVVHRIARDGKFSPSYSILADASLASPSVASLGAGKALLLCQREPGGELWRFQYAGGTWLGDSQSCAPDGFDPQTSAGSDSTVSLWSSSGQAVYQLHTRAEEPLAGGASGDWQSANSLLIAIPGRPGTLLISFRQCLAIRRGRISTILRPSCDGVSDTTLSLAAVLTRMRSPGFWLDDRTDSIQVDFSLSGRALDELFSSPGGSVAFQLVRERTNEVLGTFARAHTSDIPETDGAFTSLTLSVARLHDAGVEDSCAIQLVLTGLTDQASPVSLGSFYSQGHEDGVRHCTGQFEEEPTAVAESGAIPVEVRLHQNYPNPFNGSTTITFELPLDGDAVLEIYNTLGQRVATPLAGPMSKGQHTATVDGSGLASGSYIYRLSFTSAGEHSPRRGRDNGAMIMAKKFVLLK